MKKILHVVCVDNYLPELMEFTLPNLKAYATKCGAEFNLITERKFPDFPPTYEKMQVHELGRGAEWNILMDADFMIHPDFWDVTTGFRKDMVAFHAGYDARYWFIPDQYFMRDGRARGIATNFVAVSDWCHDVWTPLEFGWDVAKTKSKRLHIIDEYCFSRNLAKFGLKYTGINFEPEQQYMFQHMGLKDRTEDEIKACVAKAKQLLKEWGQA